MSSPFKSPPDFEGKNSYSVTVQASDGRLTGTLDVTVNVTNVDEAGTVTLLNTQPQVGTQLTAELEDPDGSISAVTWKWERSTSSNAWTIINGATSASYTPVDDDVSKSLRATATYTDDQGSSKSASATSANQVQEEPETNTAPEFEVATTRTVPENTPKGENIGDPVKATDTTDNNLTYTLGGDDAESFDIDESTGQLKTKAELDHETKDTYTVTVTAADGSDATDTITVTIEVTNVNEPPKITSGPNTATYAENDTGPVATYTATDPEGDQIVWDVSGEDAIDFRISGGILNFNAQPDHENPVDEDTDNIYHVTVEAIDRNSTTTSNRRNRHRHQR